MRGRWHAIALPRSIARVERSGFINAVFLHFLARAWPQRFDAAWDATCVALQTGHRQMRIVAAVGHQLSVAHLKTCAAALHVPRDPRPLLFLAIPRWFCRAPTSAPAHAATPAATRQPLSGVTMGAGRDGNPASVGPLRRTWSSEKLAALQGVKDDLIVLKSIWFNKPKGGDHAQRLENFYSPQAAACESRCFGDQRMPLQFQRMGPFRAATAAPSRLDTRIWQRRLLTAPSHRPQTTSSAPDSCGVASPCWPRAPRAWRTAATWSGWTWAAARG